MTNQTTATNGTDDVRFLLQENKELKTELMKRDQEIAILKRQLKRLVENMRSFTTSMIHEVTNSYDQASPNDDIGYRPYSENPLPDSGVKSFSPSHISFTGEQEDPLPSTLPPNSVTAVTVNSCNNDQQKACGVNCIYNSEINTLESKPTLTTNTSVLSDTLDKVKDNSREDTNMDTDGEVITLQPSPTSTSSIDVLTKSFDKKVKDQQSSCAENTCDANSIAGDEITTLESHPDPFSTTGVLPEKHNIEGTCNANIPMDVKISTSESSRIPICNSHVLADTSDKVKNETFDMDSFKDNERASSESSLTLTSNVSLNKDWQDNIIKEDTHSLSSDEISTVESSLTPASNTGVFEKSDGQQNISKEHMFDGNIVGEIEITSLESSPSQTDNTVELQNSFDKGTDHRNNLKKDKGDVKVFSSEMTSLECSASQSGDTNVLKNSFDKGQNLRNNVKENKREVSIVTGSKITCSETSPAVSDNIESRKSSETFTVLLSELDTNVCDKESENNFKPSEFNCIANKESENLKPLLKQISKDEHNFLKQMKRSKKKQKRLPKEQRTENKIENKANLREKPSENTLLEVKEPKLSEQFSNSVEKNSSGESKCILNAITGSSHQSNELKQTENIFHKNESKGAKFSTGNEIILCEKINDNSPKVKKLKLSKQLSDSVERQPGNTDKCISSTVTKKVHQNNACEENENISNGNENMGTENKTTMWKKPHERNLPVTKKQKLSEQSIGTVEIDKVVSDPLQKSNATKQTENVCDRNGNKDDEFLGGNKTNVCEKTNELNLPVAKKRKLTEQFPSSVESKSGNKFVSSTNAANSQQNDEAGQTASEQKGSKAVEFFTGIKATVCEKSNERNLSETKKPKLSAGMPSLIEESHQEACEGPSEVISLTKPSLMEKLSQRYNNFHRDLLRKTRNRAQTRRAENQPEQVQQVQNYMAVAKSRTTIARMHLQESQKTQKKVLQAKERGIYMTCIDQAMEKSSKFQKPFNSDLSLNYLENMQSLFGVNKEVQEESTETVTSDTVESVKLNDKSDDLTQVKGKASLRGTGKKVSLDSSAIQKGLDCFVKNMTGKKSSTLKSQQNSEAEQSKNTSDKKESKIDSCSITTKSQSLTKAGESCIVHVQKVYSTDTENALHTDKLSGQNNCEESSQMPLSKPAEKKIDSCVNSDSPNVAVNGKATEEGENVARSSATKTNCKSNSVSHSEVLNLTDLSSGRTSPEIEKCCSKIKLIKKAQDNVGNLLTHLSVPPVSEKKCPDDPFKKAAILENNVTNLLDSLVNVQNLFLTKSPVKSPIRNGINRDLETNKVKPRNFLSSYKIPKKQPAIEKSEKDDKQEQQDQVKCSKGKSFLNPNDVPALKSTVRSPKLNKVDLNKKFVTKVASPSASSGNVKISSRDPRRKPSSDSKGQSTSPGRLSLTTKNKVDSVAKNKVDSAANINPVQAQKVVAFIGDIIASHNSPLPEQTMSPAQDDVTFSETVGAYDQASNVDAKVPEMPDTLQRILSDYEGFVQGIVPQNVSENPEEIKNDYNETMQYLRSLSENQPHDKNLQLGMTALHEMMVVKMAIAMQREADAKRAEALRVSQGDNKENHDVKPHTLEKSIETTVRKRVQMNKTENVTHKIHKSLTKEGGSLSLVSKPSADVISDTQDSLLWNMAVDDEDLSPRTGSNQSVVLDESRDSIYGGLESNEYCYADLDVATIDENGAITNQGSPVTDSKNTGSALSQSIPTESREITEQNELASDKQAQNEVFNESNNKEQMQEEIEQMEYEQSDVTNNSNSDKQMSKEIVEIEKELVEIHNELESNQQIVEDIKKKEKEKCEVPSESNNNKLTEETILEVKEQPSVNNFLFSPLKTFKALLSPMKLQSALYSPSSKGSSAFDESSPNTLDFSEEERKDDESMTNEQEMTVFTDRFLLCTKSSVNTGSCHEELSSSKIQQISDSHCESEGHRGSTTHSFVETKDEILPAKNPFLTSEVIKENEKSDNVCDVSKELSVHCGSNHDAISLLPPEEMFSPLSNVDEEVETNVTNTSQESISDHGSEHIEERATISDNIVVPRDAGVLDDGDTGEESHSVQEVRDDVKKDIEKGASDGSIEEGEITDEDDNDDDGNCNSEVSDNVNDFEAATLEMQESVNNRAPEIQDLRYKLKSSRERSKKEKGSLSDKTSDKSKRKSRRVSGSRTKVSPRLEKFSSDGGDKRILKDARRQIEKSDRRGRPDRSERRSNDRPDRSEKRSSDRPNRSERRSSDRPDRSKRSSDRPDRSERRSSDRPDISERRSSDRPDRSERRSSDRPDRSERSSSDCRQHGQTIPSSKDLYLKEERYEQNPRDRSGRRSNERNHQSNNRPHKHSAKKERHENSPRSCVSERRSREKEGRSGGTPVQNRVSCCCEREKRSRSLDRHYSDQNRTSPICTDRSRSRSNSRHRIQSKNREEREYLKDTSSKRGSDKRLTRNTSSKVNTRKKERDFHSDRSPNVRGQKRKRSPSSTRVRRR